MGNRGFHSYLGCFKAQDGWIFLSGTTNPIWKRLMRAIGREDLANDPKLCKNDMVRFYQADRIDKVIQAWIEHKTSVEVVKILQAARVPCGVVNTIDKLEKDPQVMARDMIINVGYPQLGDIPVPNLPFKLSLTPARIKFRAPKIGEDNEEIYGNLLNFNKKEIKRLRKEDII